MTPRITAAHVLLAATWALPAAAWGKRGSVLYAFPSPDGPNGAQPAGGLVGDPSGALYGTTEFGGNIGTGAVGAAGVADSSFYGGPAGAGTVFGLSP